MGQRQTHLMHSTLLGTRRACGPGCAVAHGSQQLSKRGLRCTAPHLHSPRRQHKSVALSPYAWYTSVPARSTSTRRCTQATGTEPVWRSPQASPCTVGAAAVHRPAALAQPLCRHVRTKCYGARNAFCEPRGGDRADACRPCLPGDKQRISPARERGSCAHAIRALALALAAHEPVHWPDNVARLGQWRNTHVAKRRDVAPSVAACVGKRRKECTRARWPKRNGQNLRAGVERELIVHARLGRHGQVRSAPRLCGQHGEDLAQR
jgi:hypothetical protein